MSQEQKSFWTTLPGILTGCGTVLGAVAAIGGCLLALVQAGLIKPLFPTPVPPLPSIVVPSTVAPGNNEPDPAQPSSESPTATLETPFSPLSTETPSLTPTPFYSGPPLIAFVSNSSGRSVIYTMQADGVNRRAITSFEYDSDTPSWSVGGQWIYFSANPAGNYDVYRMRWDGSDVTRLSSDSRDEFWPRLSPNGLKIVYGVKFGEDNFQLFVMNPDGSGVQNLSNSSMNDERPSWAPDGNSVVFMHCRGPADPTDLRCEIYRRNADGTDVPHNLTNSSFSEIWPELSRDGSAIAYAANIRSYDNTAPYNVDIFLANPDGTMFRRVTTSSSVDTNPSWSPDGSRILFKSQIDDASETDIWVISANGTGLSQLTFFAGQ